MKLLPVFLLLASLTVASAQLSDGPIKATVTMLGDGRQKNMIVNPETRSAEETITDKKGKIYSKTLYQLDDRNLPSVATFYDGKGKALYSASYQRDAADRVSEEAYTSMAGKSLGRRVYTYGANNKVTRLDVYDAVGNLIVPQKPASPGRPDKKKR